MSTCYCGRTFRPPMCDNTHVLDDEAYAKLREEIDKLREKICQNNNTTYQQKPTT